MQQITDIIQYPACNSEIFSITSNIPQLYYSALDTSLAFEVSDVNYLGIVLTERLNITLQDKETDEYFQFYSNYFNITIYDP